MIFPKCAKNTVSYFCYFLVGDDTFEEREIPRELNDREDSLNMRGETLLEDADKTISSSNFSIRRESRESSVVGESVVLPKVISKHLTLLDVLFTETAVGPCQ